VTGIKLKKIAKPVLGCIGWWDQPEAEQRQWADEGAIMVRNGGGAQDQWYAPGLVKKDDDYWTTKEITDWMTNKAAKRVPLKALTFYELDFAAMDKLIGVNSAAAKPPAGK
jgi:hypothetical protein